VQEAGTQFHVMIRNYLCVALLKNCTSNTTRVVSLSLSIFIPMVRHFRTILKNEIEAFVTNVFFVILDSKNSSNEHKSLVVRTFQEIGSDPQTLAEIFLNYDCDLSAVDLFHRIVNSLSKLSRLQEPTTTRSLLGGPSEAQMERARTETRELRLAAMKALRQILASLHASIVKPLVVVQSPTEDAKPLPPQPQSPSQNLVELYGSKKKRRAEESEAILRFNQKPKAGISYAAKCGHIDPDDPADVARYLWKHKDEFDKTQIGEYLGREVEYQGGFALKVLHEYARLMDFADLVFDDAIRYFLSGFRLPGEAQKVSAASLGLISGLNIFI
jgi:brefeldin A-inhibited guanine nucleotide-exchange protein